MILLLNRPGFHLAWFASSGELVVVHHGENQVADELGLEVVEKLTERGMTEEEFVLLREVETEPEPEAEPEPEEEPWPEGVPRTLAGMHYTKQRDLVEQTRDRRVLEHWATYELPPTVARAIREQIASAVEFRYLPVHKGQQCGRDIHQADGFGTTPGFGEKIRIAEDQGDFQIDLLQVMDMPIIGFSAAGQVFPQPFTMIACEDDDRFLEEFLHL